MRPNEADDVVQGFVAKKLIASEILADARRERGRFRTYLLTIFQRYLIDEQRGSATRQRQHQDFAHELTKTRGSEVAPSDPFDLAWARGLLDETVSRMKTQLQRGGREQLWGVFECRVLDPIVRQADPPPYEQMVRDFGFESRTQACSAVVTAKRIFARLLREVISSYAADDAAVEDELNELRKILARGGSQGI
jgi:RNA polymerase sigma-70 factor (ECF subfamily)